MKKVLWLIPVIGMVMLLGAKSPTSLAMTDEQCLAVEKAVNETHARFLQYAEQLDADTMYSLILDGGKATIIQNNQILSRQEALDTTRKGFTGLSKLQYKFDSQQVTVISPDMAILAGKGQSIATTGSGETFTNDFTVSSVFVLRDKEWKIIHGHYSSPARP